MMTIKLILGLFGGFLGCYWSILGLSWSLLGRLFILWCDLGAMVRPLREGKSALFCEGCLHFYGLRSLGGFFRGPP